MPELKENEKYCYFVKKNEQFYQDKCTQCGYPHHLRPQNLAHIETHASVVDFFEDFQNACWERFIGTYHNAIVRYILCYANLSQDHWDWAEDIASKLYNMAMSGKIKRSADIRFRDILRRKLKDILIKERQKQTRRGKHLQQKWEQEIAHHENQAERLLMREILEEVYNKVMESPEFNNYDRSIIQFALTNGELPNADDLQKLWGVTPANAWKIMQRFKNRCKRYILEMLALGKDAKKAEYEIFKAYDF